MRRTPGNHQRFLIELLVGWIVLVGATAFAGNGLPGGPISAAIARESSRIAADSGSDVGDDWRRVRNLASGFIIVVTRSGERERYLVHADELGLTVLNLSGPMLPPHARDTLRRVVSEHPDYFASAQQGGTVILDGSLQLRAEGVFLGGRKVADLGEVGERIARSDVAQVRTRRRGRGVWGHLGPLGGSLVGGMSAGLVSGFVCQGIAGRDRCDTGAFLTGMMAGAVGGGAYGFRAARRETEEVVYQTRASRSPEQ